MKVCRCSAMMVAALAGVSMLPTLCPAQPQVRLPQGTRAVWDMAEAYRETTPTRERICINGLRASRFLEFFGIESWLRTQRIPTGFRLPAQGLRGRPRVVEQPWGHSIGRDANPNGVASPARRGRSGRNPLGVVLPFWPHPQGRRVRGSADLPTLGWKTECLRHSPRRRPTQRRSRVIK